MTSFSRIVRKAIPPCGCILALLSLTACGKSESTGTVTGTIKSQGKPIPRGLITFLPEKGEPWNCAIIDGKFDSGPIPTGPYQIIIALNELAMEAGVGAKAPAANKGAIGEGLGAGDGKAAPAAANTKAKKFVLDPRYGDATTSGLSMTVEPGPNTYDQDLP